MCFSKTSDESNFAPLVTWSELVNKDNEFVNKGGDFVIQAEFSVKPGTNAKVTLDLEFLNSSLVNSDCTLLVEGRRFAVSKGLLSTYSNYFKALFYGPFSEKNQDEVELEGVIAAEFVLLLMAMYQPVSDKNVLYVGKNCECLLRMADYFQVRLVTKRCSNFLKSCPTSKIKMATKLQLAQDYNLSDVMELCVGQCKTMADLTDIFQSSVYYLLDSETKLRVYENVTKVNCTT